MPTRRENPQVQHPPEWAVDEATDELYDVKDPQRITARAWELVQERKDERHDEYDDLDQGGEA